MRDDGDVKKPGEVTRFEDGSVNGTLDAAIHLTSPEDVPPKVVRDVIVPERRHAARRHLATRTRILQLTPSGASLTRTALEGSLKLQQPVPTL